MLQEIGSIEKKKVVDLQVATLSYNEVLDHIFSLSASKVSSYVCFANAHMAVEAHLDKSFRNSVNNATIVASDGMSVVMALKYIHKVRQGRSAGMDMIFDVLAGAEKRGLSVFLFGSKEHTLKKFVTKANNEHPTLKIAGTLAPPYSEWSSSVEDLFIEKIKESGAQLVLVSLGCPKQEKWMAANSEKINATMLGIGGALSLYAMETKRAPEFMQKYCLEWLYRLYQEPRRLWKRYLVTNTLFIFYFFKQMLFGSKEANR